MIVEREAKTVFLLSSSTSLTRKRDSALHPCFPTTEEYYEQYPNRWFDCLCEKAKKNKRLPASVASTVNQG